MASMGFRPRVEAKYTYRFGDQTLLQMALEAVCVKDPLHAHDRVNSVYFDTPERTLLAEKVNSDYLKTKVRLRWYGQPTSTDPNRLIPTYLEVKGKQGVKGRKPRVLIDVPVRILDDHPDPFDELAGLSDRARELGYVPPGPIFPMIVISYERSRFIDPESGGRISLDRGIGYSRVNHRFFPDNGPRMLRYGVLEIKSATGNLPRGFLTIRNYLNKRDSFSKYEECWQLHADHLYRRDFRWMHFKK